MSNRREFLFGSIAVPLAGALQSLPSAPQPGGVSPPGGFPVSDYTPFGYLDNPFHMWNLHRSGVLRSLPGIGFGFYYPAGPGGYFNHQQNAIYEGHLRIGILVGTKRYWTPVDFAPGQLTEPCHSKNIFRIRFQRGRRAVEHHVQAGENALRDFGRRVVGIGTDHGCGRCRRPRRSATRERPIMEV